MSETRLLKNAALAVLGVVVIVFAVVALRHGSSASGPAATPTPTPPVATNDQPVAAFIGDSYTAGSDMGGNGPHNWSALVSQDEHWTQQVFAVGGSGYTTVGTGSTTFGQRVSQVAGASPTPDKIVVAGSLNDMNASPAKVHTAALDTLRRIRRFLPNAELVVIGPFYPGTPGASQFAVRDAVKSAALAVHATWIDPVDWFAGHSDLIGSDHTHPTDAGHRYIARKVEAALR